MFKFTASALLIIANSAGSSNNQHIPHSVVSDKIPVVHPAKNPKVKHAFTTAVNVSQLESLSFNQPLYEPGNPTDWRLWTAIYVNNEQLAQDMINTYPDHILHNKNHTDMVNAIGTIYNYKATGNLCHECRISTLGLAITKGMNNVTNALLNKPYINVNIKSGKFKYAPNFSLFPTPLTFAINTENENVLRALLRHPDIDVSLWINAAPNSVPRAIDYAKLYYPRMIPIIQQEMCDFISKAHQDQKRKRDQFLRHIPDPKSCDYIMNHVAYDAEHKGDALTGDIDGSKSSKSSSTGMIVVGVIAMTLGAAVLCYFIVKAILMRKKADQGTQEDTVVV